MAKPVVIFGIGTFGRVARAYLQHDWPGQVEAFTVHERFVPGDRVLGLPVVAWERAVETYPPERCDLCVAIGYSNVNRSREALFGDARARGYRMIRYVSSRAAVHPDATVGEGAFILDHAVVEPYASVGENTVLWSGCHVGHDTVVGNHVYVALRAAIAGKCTIEARAFIGANATVRDGLTIGAGSVVGAGAVILHDTAPGSVHKAAEAAPSAVPADALRRI